MFYYFERVTDMERMRQIFILINPPDDCNSQHWVRSKPGARDFIALSYMGIRAQAFGPPSAAFLRVSDGNWIGIGAARSGTSAHMGFQHHRHNVDSQSWNF